MKHPAHFGGDYSRQFDFFTAGIGPGPTDSAERGYGGPPQEPLEPVTNINASPAVKPGESTFPTGSSNHSGTPEEPVGSLYMGADDSSNPDPEAFDDADTQVVTSPDEDEEIDRIDDDLAEETALTDLEDEEFDADADEEIDDDAQTSTGDVGEPRR